MSPKFEREELLKDFYKKPLLEIKKLCRNNKNVPVTIEAIYEILETYKVAEKYHTRVMELSEIRHL